MKMLLTGCFCLLAFACIGQSLTLDNTWMAGSKMIFIGVENKLILRGKIESLISFQSNKAGISRKGDTLIVQPTQPGPLDIVLKTLSGSITQQFTVGYLPMFGLIITDDPADTKDVSKEKILKAKNMFLISIKSDIKLYEDYLVTEVVMTINDKVYQSPGDILSEDAKRAIAGLQAGSVIKVEQVTAKSKSTGKELRLRAPQSFTVL